MKNPERVAELLAELRTLSETDFERHRLDVLERDLTAPPTVEVIDDTHQRFNGVTYLAKGDGHFNQTKSIHRDIWQYYYGEIPDDYQIHHVDNNKANNDISNLQCVTKQEHRNLHRKYPPTKICPVCGKIFAHIHPSQVCCSKECGHKSTAMKNKMSQPSLPEKICPQCGRKFKPANSKTVYCSRSCAYQSGWKRTLEKQCAHCGKTFSADRPQRIFCSRSCAAKARNQVTTDFEKS